MRTAEPGVVFTYPANRQLDVPLGTRIVVTFSDPVTERPRCVYRHERRVLSRRSERAGRRDARRSRGDGKACRFEDAQLEAGTTYQVFVRSELAPTATNLPASGPLVRVHDALRAAALRPRRR